MEARLRNADRHDSAAADGPDGTIGRGHPGWLRPALIALFVFFAVTAVHAPVLHSQASSLDDFQFLGTNKLVQNPSWNSVARFFGEVSNPSTVGGYYIPLTMTSLMLDYAAGGRPDDLRVFHRTNLALHLLNVLLILTILVRLFGSWEVAAAVALLFGLHPLTVEPVAWVSERKTLLATFLGLASMATYLQGIRGPRAWRVSSIALFALALLAKPTILPLPLLLILIDVWPMRRASRAALWEKWPYFGLAVLSGVIALVSHVHTAGVVTPGAGGVVRWPLQAGRLLGFYLQKIVRPSNLSCVYPDPGPFTFGNPIAVASTFLLPALTVVLIWLCRRWPGALVSWLIFVVALLPTLGLLRYSWVVVSDKYVYFPAFGLLLGLAGLLVALQRRRATRTRLPVFLALAAVALLAAESIGTRRAYTPWRDTLTLYQHMETIAPNSSIVQGKLGYLYKEMGDYAAALPHFDQAVRLAPHEAETAFLHGAVLCNVGRVEEGAAEIRRALQLDPTFKEASDQLGCALAMMGRQEEAAAQFRRAIELDPTNADVRLRLAAALLAVGGRDAEAVRELRDVLARAPERVDAMNQLAWTLATSADATVRDGAEAVRLADRAVGLTGGRDPNILDTQAAAHAAAGDPARAIAIAREALRAAEEAGNDVLAKEIQARMRSYVP